MVHFKLWEILVIYLIGGKIILIIFTAIRHQSLSSFYGRKIIMRPGSPFKEPDTGSWNFPITVTNNSNVIIKNVHALITIEYDKTDIREDPDFLIDVWKISFRSSAANFLVTLSG
jgi:hypothetical protein